MGRPAKRITKRASLPRIPMSGDLVKSAARALQVIEFLDSIRRPVSVVELCRYLDYPQSSVSGLVHTLMTLGYLQFDAEERTYTLSSKVSFLGLWVRPEIFRDGELWALIKEVRAETGGTVVLATRQGAFSHYLYVEPSRAASPLNISVGAHVPLTASSTGFAMLSQHGADDLWKIVAPLYSPHGRVRNTVEYSQVAALAQETRRNGFSYIEANHLGTAAVAVPLPLKGAEVELSVGVAASLYTMRTGRERIQQTLVRAASAYPASSPPPLN